MVLKEGWALLYQQFTALFRKNLLLSWRNKRATCLQLFSSFVFILLIFCIEEAMKASEASSTAYKNVTDPTLLVSPPILPCEEKFFVKLPCYDFVWSGNHSRRLADIASAIMANNPGRPIPTNKVQSFKDPKEVDAWLLSHPLQVPGALHFVERNATVISYGIQTNSSAERKRGQTEDPTFKFLVPLQVAAEREIARSLIGDPKFSWGFGFKEFARPALAGESISALSGMGPLFFLAFSMFGFVLQLGSLVTEKELKLRQAMTMMGVYDSAYWLSWLAWEGILTFVSSLFLVLSGMMFRFDFFLKNSFALVFLLFLLFQLNMIGLAFVLSSFITKSSSATTVGFLVFLVGFITQIVSATGFPYSSIYAASRRVMWSLFPPNTFFEGLKLLLDATSTPTSSGISWSKRANIVFQWLLGTFLLWFGLAIYFDNIIPNASGVRKPIFYFLTPGYWTGKGGNKVEVPPVEHTTPEDKDVLEEETEVKQQAMDGIVDPNIAVQIHGLAKTYPGTTKLGCCKCMKTSPFHAVK
ncbi:hypothetical protein CARUB_v10008037mg, partial [Capsella rubella]